MPLVIKDRVMETTSSTGTGTITLSGAVAGYQSFSVIGNGNTTYYAIVGGSEWEVGLGTVGSGTLTRDTVLESSNSGSLVNFSAGSKQVFCTYPAERAVLTDAIGVSVQAYDAQLADIAALTPTDNTFIVGNGTNFVSEDAATARTSLGLGTLATQNGTFSGTSSGTNTGDQNLFSTIAVSGQSNVVADSTSDTLTLAAGEGIKITTNASTDTITIEQNQGICRAWVNFNGSGTVAIRASFNVSSITDNGTGNYTVNFTNALSDTNYSVAGTVGTFNTTNGTAHCIGIIQSSLSGSPSLMSTSQVRIGMMFGQSTSFADNAMICISVFR